MSAFLRPGSLIAWQNAVAAKVQNTHDLLQLPISLVANRDQSGISSGSVFLDNGQYIDELTNNQFEYYQV